MESEKFVKFVAKIKRPFVVLVAGIGLVSAATPSFSATNYTQAADENSVESFTSFILYGGPELDIERAFCKLRELDEEAAQSLKSEYEAKETVASLDLNSCTTTGLARLVII